MEILTNIIYYIIPFIVLLGILVFIHEFGHFIVARMLGVKVVAFSIGFGKELWSRTDKKGTTWKISAIPLGGYCQFLGDGDASSSTTDDTLETLSEEEKQQAFALQSTWKKILIVVAGPLFNYLLAILLFFGLFVTYGKAVIPTYIGEVIPGSAADKVGIRPGDVIMSINGNPTPDFRALIYQTDMALEDPVAVEVERKGMVRLTPEYMSYEVCGENRNGKMIGVKSLTPEVDENGESKEVGPIIGEVMENGPAQRAGLQEGDVLKTINGTELATFDDLKQYVATHGDDELEITYLRRIIYNANLSDSVSEDLIGGVKRRMLGVVSSATFAETKQKMGLLSALRAGVEEAYDITAVTLRGLGQILTGQRGSKDVGGIIRIAEMSGDASKKGGLSGFIYFMALISVNLGLINLFPIPVLDGGNLVIYLIEMVIRRELKPKVKDYIFKFGLIVLLGIMVFATWNDIVHLTSRLFQ